MSTPTQPQPTSARTRRGITGLLLPPASASTGFWIALILVAVLGLGALLLLPRGGQPGAAVAAPQVTAQFGEDATATVLLEIQDQGWRASTRGAPYRVDIRLTIDNQSQEMIPRWVDVTVMPQSQRGSEGVLEQIGYDSLETVHVPAGHTTGYDYTFRHSQPCGEFLVHIDETTEDVPEHERRSAQMTITVPGQGC